MSLTILEMSKTIQDPMVKGVIETLGMEPGVLEFLPMYENKGLAHRYTAISLQPGGHVLDLITRRSLNS